MSSALVQISNQWRDADSHRRGLIDRSQRSPNYLAASYLQTKTSPRFAEALTGGAEFA